MTYVTIPVSSLPDQSMLVTIPVDGSNLYLALRIRYNTEGGYWFMAVSDAKTQKLLIDNVPLLTSSSLPSNDILSSYRYLGLGSAFVAKADKTSLDHPDDTTLGTSFLLVWGDTAV